MNLEQIKEKLSDRNLAEVARRIGVTRAYLSSIMKGQKISEEMRKKLSDYLENK